MATPIPVALTPTSAAERLRALDVLRGFALLGIALMNVEFFTRPMSDAGAGIEAGLLLVDWLADAFAYVFVQGKFWTLFSLLFGMGFAVMATRAEGSERAFVPLYLRRSLALMLIGFLHGWLVWSGDVLFAYSLGALALLALRQLPLTATWMLGALLYMGVAGLLVLGGAVTALGIEDPGADKATDALRSAEIAAYSVGSYAQACAVRLRFFVSQLGGYIALLPMVLGMFLIGTWLVRSGAIRDPDSHPLLYRRLLWIGGPIGLLLVGASLALSTDPVHPGTPLRAVDMFSMALHLLGSPLLALAYLSVIVRALQRGPGLLDLFAPAGRMALTNYLMQSVIGTLLFYGYGLGLWGEVGRAAQLLGVCVVVAAQVALSHAWLARYRFGPAEWLWRAVTYLQWPRMRRADGVAAIGAMHG